MDIIWRFIAMKFKTIKMTTDEARELYKKSGLTYRDIGSKEIAMLMDCIKAELLITETDLKFSLPNLRKSDINYNDDGSIKNCYIMVNGDYFKRREAISFNTASLKGDEFIGFAGWASTANTQPFINAFVIWLNQFKNNKNDNKNTIL